MANVKDFKAGMKVRCVGNSRAELIVGKNYEVLSAGKYGVQVINENGDKWEYHVNRFEPVSENVAKDNDELQAEEIFKVGDKVQCFDNWLAYLSSEKEYEVLRVGNYTLNIIDDSGNECDYDIGLFEPVSETATQSNDEIDSTPCETRTVAKFEVGDKVYSNLSGRIETIEEIKDKALYSISGRYMVASASCQATQENYEMLCKIYPHIEFEKPPVALKGSNLCRAMLDKGWKYVPCYVSDVSEKDAEECQCDEIVISFRDDEFIANDYWQYAVPFDLRTGEPLTEEVLK